MSNLYWCSRFLAAVRFGWKSFVLHCDLFEHAKFLSYFLPHLWTQIFMPCTDCIRLSSSSYCIFLTYGPNRPTKKELDSAPMTAPPGTRQLSKAHRVLSSVLSTNMVDSFTSPSLAHHKSSVSPSTTLTIPPLPVHFVPRIQCPTT